jgi:sporulation protein YlmC with PRC-barrel domain
VREKGYAFPRTDPLKTLIPLKRVSNAHGLEPSKRLPNPEGHEKERRRGRMVHPTRAGIGLVRLGESGFVPANPEDDVRGKDVYDAQGNRVGSVEDLYIEHNEREVRFLEVGGGGFLGIGEKRFLAPVEAVTQVAEEWVTVEPERTQKVEGPAPFDTRVVPPPSTEERRAEDYTSPPYGDTGRTADRLDMGGYGPYGR